MDCLVCINLKSGSLQFIYDFHLPCFFVIEIGIDNPIVVRRYFDIMLLENTNIFPTNLAEEESKFQNNILPCAGTVCLRAPTVSGRTHIIRR